MRKLLAICLLALAGPVLAATVDVPLPRDRPASSEAESATVPMPRERPAATETEPSSSAPEASSSEPPASSSEPSASSSEQPSSSVEPPPPPPPPRDYQVACPAMISGQVTAKMLPPIHEGQCGAQSPLSVSAVSANGRTIPLNAPVVTDCGMATALPDWVGEVDSYVFAHDKTRIKTVNLGTNYACRNVDNAKTGNLSFHAFADALDVVGFTLEDGRTISIAPGFRGTPEQGSESLHFARDAACTHFMTVLSPDADEYHQDNMHIDLGCHGKQCTTRLCE